jgi:restriction modification system DNA specificity domain protein
VFKAEELFQNITDRNHPDETVLTIIQGKGTLPREQAGRNIHYDDASLSNYKKVEQGDFIIHLRSFEGGLEMANEAGIVSPAYTILRCKRPHSSLFYDAYFHTDEFINHNLSKSVEGIRDGRQISYEAFKWLGIPYCEPTEQEKISTLFSAFNERIAKQRDLVESLKKYKRGVNNQILSQIDNSYNCRLGSVCEIVGGGTPDTLHAEYWGNTVEWFTPSEIGKTKYVNNSVRKLSDIGLDNSSAKLLPIGTVLLTTRATLGEMSIAKRECSTNQGFQSLIPHTDRVSSEYLYYMQIIIKPWCEKYASGNTFREISKSALSDCIIPIPDRARQEQIVKLLSSIDMIIDAAESISMSLSKIRHGLMQQLFI